MNTLTGRRQGLNALTKSTPRTKAVRSARAAAETGSRGALYLYGPVSSYGWFLDRVVSARSVIDALKDLDDVTAIDVHIHSPGGDAFEGIAIMNALRNHDADITVYVDGLAASAASYIAMAGSEIVMCPGSQLMIHDASLYTYGNAAELRDDADWLDKQSDNIATQYARRAGGTKAAWRALMQAETWYSDEEAVAAGLADRVAGDDEPATADDEQVASEGVGFDVEDSWDLSVFTYAGRSAAPAPAAMRRSTPPAASADGSTPTEGGSAVAFSDEQLTDMRRQLGVAEDADEATILAALAEALDERSDTPAHTDTTPEGSVLVEADVLDQMRADAAAGREALNRQRLDDRNRAIDNAIQTGRITVARREHWQNAWDADPEGAAAQLANLAPGLVPVTELGHDGDPVENTSTGTVDAIRESDDYKNWSM